MVVVLLTSLSLASKAASIQRSPAVFSSVGLALLHVPVLSNVVSSRTFSTIELRLQNALLQEEESSYFYQEL